jgi:hypothetical protein
MRYLLAILFCISTVSRVLSQENPPRIPVVKSWEALQELPPIDLGDGVKLVSKKTRFRNGAVLSFIV